MLRLLGRKIRDTLAAGCDAGFWDLDWQGYCASERKTIELGTRDMSDAVERLTGMGYAVVSLSRHAKLINVIPVPCEMSEGILRVTL